MIKLNYQLETTLTAALAVAVELADDAGMTPETIVCDGKLLRFSDDDALKLQNATITEDEYILRNIVV